MKNGPYTMLVAPAEYPGMKYRGRYAYEHLIVWWRTHGILPAPGMEIHHRNGNHRDNDIENLKLLTKREHRLEHGKIRTASRTTKARCYRCRKDFPILLGELKSRMKKKTQRVFCGRSCAVTNQHIEARARKALRANLG